jgi:hypothetical protein
VRRRVDHHDVRRQAEQRDLVGEEGESLGRGEDLGLADRVPDVFESGQRPERRAAVVGRVVMHRIVVAQPVVRRVRVGEEYSVERVVLPHGNPSNGRC